MLFYRKHAILFSQRDLDRVMLDFHASYKDYGHVGCSQKVLERRYGNNAEHYAPVIDYLVDAGYLLQEHEHPVDGNLYRLSRKGTGYFAEQQRAKRVKRYGLILDIVKMLLSAIMGAVISAYVTGALPK